MEKKKLVIESIPAILWGAPSAKIYLAVHGKMSCKEEAEGFAKIAVEKGYQVLSFDLPEHGDRKNEKHYPCDVWNGMRDLTYVMEYVQKHWSKISLYACSIGAYFSLMTYQDVTFEHCLFLSPILNMERLIENMMSWFQISEAMLEEEKRIKTPMGETLDWKYYTFVRNHPITKWESETSILYGTKDNLTEIEVVQKFQEDFHANVRMLEGGEHWFHTEEQVIVLNRWLNDVIQ